MLYTTKQISEMYSSEDNGINSYMITHTWIPNGLKHIRGKKNSYLFKKEWVDEYLEEQACSNVIQKTNIKTNKKKTRMMIRKNCNLKVI